MAPPSGGPADLRLPPPPHLTKEPDEDQKWSQASSFTRRWLYSTEVNCGTVAKLSPMPLLWNNLAVVFPVLQNLTKWLAQQTAAYSSHAMQVMSCSTWTGSAAETSSQMSLSWSTDSSSVHTRPSSWLAGACSLWSDCFLLQFEDEGADRCALLSCLSVGSFTPSLLTPTSATLTRSVWTQRWTQRASPSCWSSCTPPVSH